MSILENIDRNKPLLMAILNITPDSFSDGGVLYKSNQPNIEGVDGVLARAEKMLEEGADILDVGGESTRPGAVRPSIDQELTRVIPVIEALKQNFNCNISIDTSSAEVMRQAVSSGARLINDVRALKEPGALQAALESQADICLMHMRGSPESMQDNPQYQDVLSEVTNFLKARVDACVKVGINQKRICIDPGFGFGKSFEHNMQLMQNLSGLTQLNLPLLVGVSRKGMIGQITGKSIDQRTAGSLAMAQIALDRGANILRVHDVAETCDMIRVWSAIQQSLEAGK